MAIKVKHTNSVASTVAAAHEGGRGQRRAKDALALSQQEALQQQAAEDRASRERMAMLQSARSGGRGAPGFVSAPSPGGGSAPLSQAHASMLSPPTPRAGGGGGGGGGRGRSSSGSAAAPGVASRLSRPASASRAPTSGASRPGGSRSSSFSSSSSDPQPASPKKVTGTDAFSNPHDGSEWNWDKGVWERDYRPGEMEADAAREKVDALSGTYADPTYVAETKYTLEQRREADRINAAVENARRTGRYTEEELADLRAQASAQIAGIKPLPRLPEQTAQQRFNDSVVDLGNGMRGYYDANGKLNPLPEGGSSSAPGMDEKTFLNLYNKIASEGGVDENGNKIPLTNEQIVARINEGADAYRDYQKRGQPASGGAGQPAPDGMPAAVDLPNGTTLTGTPAEILNHWASPPKDGAAKPRQGAIFMDDGAKPAPTPAPRPYVLYDKNGNTFAGNSPEEALAHQANAAKGIAPGTGEVVVNGKAYRGTMRQILDQVPDKALQAGQSAQAPGQPAPPPENEGGSDSGDDEEDE